MSRGIIVVDDHFVVDDVLVLLVEVLEVLFVEVVRQVGLLVEDTHRLGRLSAWVASFTRSGCEWRWAAGRRRRILDRRRLRRSHAQRERYRRVFPAAERYRPAACHRGRVAEQTVGAVRCSAPRLASQRRGPTLST